MTKPLSKEAREKVVQAYGRGLGTIYEIAKMFDISPGTVSNYLKRYRETGDLTRKPKAGKTPVLTQKNLNILKKIVSPNKKRTLRELCAEFKKKTGIKVAMSTIHRGCAQLKKEAWKK